ncbi:lipase family protein [Allorhodopirellula heiligendammensis]|uniref:Lipase (Class 3) n=1 Tax=Allorhodopirellula heiligendammensis TaxID=2714739 RepID=A0A5C6BGB7_9BACT|nr:lipase family protein [Allorhodopirellula heiligendammensis]TWU10531.1 Lipase (class 3) [Allorhodopirellula heiligendammensis]
MKSLLFACTFFILLVGANRVQAQSYSASGNRIEESSFGGAVVAASGDVPLDSEFVSRLRSTSIAGDNPPFAIVADLAMLSGEVYRNDHETVSYFVRGLGFERFATITNDQENLMVHVMDAPGVTLVVFRGTDDRLDWLTNLDLRAKTCSQGVFHRGFIDAFDAIRADTQTFISKQSGQRLWITGHSLGGAMAVLCAFDQKLSREVSADVITFGQPRVTDAKGCRNIDTALKDHYVRVARPTDVVSRIPPAIPFMTDYGHAGLHIRLGNKGLAIGPSARATMRQASFQSDEFGKACIVESVIEIHGSVFDEPPITLEELQALPGQPIEYDPNIREGQVVRFGPGTVAQVAFKYAIKKAIAWIVEQHSMDDYLRLVRSYRG